MAVAALVAATALAVSGCGGGDDGEGDTAATTTTTGEQTTTAATTTTGGAGGAATDGGASYRKASQRHSIPAVVFAVFTSGDKAKACGDDYVTQRYLNAAYGGKAGCVQAQAPGSVARSLNLNDVITSTQPGKATARATPKGGVYSGERLSITLVREDGFWKVDGLKSNAPVGP